MKTFREFYEERNDMPEWGYADEHITIVLERFMDTVNKYLNEVVKELKEEK